MAAGMVWERTTCGVKERPLQCYTQSSSGLCPGEHERPLRPGDDREPAAPPLLPGRRGDLPVSGLSGEPPDLSQVFSTLPQCLCVWEENQTWSAFMCVLQKERFLKTGWEHADALDMMTVYSMLPQDDVARYCTDSTLPVMPISVGGTGSYKWICCRGGGGKDYGKMICWRWVGSV